MIIEEAQKAIIDYLLKGYKQSGQNPWVECGSLEGKLAIPKEIYGKALKSFMDSVQLDIDSTAKNHRLQRAAFFFLISELNRTVILSNRASGLAAAPRSVRRFALLLWQLWWCFLLFLHSFVEALEALCELLKLSDMADDAQTR